MLAFSTGATGYHADRGTFARDYQQAFEHGDARVLVLGSSRVAASLDAATLTRGLGAQTYNLAFNQANLTYTHHLLRAYLEEAREMPEVVILGVSWFSFDTRRLAYKEYASQFVYRHPILFWDELLLNKRNQLANGLLTLARTLERSGATYQDFDATKKRHPNQDSTRVNYVFDPGDEGFLRTFPGGESQMAERELEAFGAILELLDSKGIPVVFYTSPEDRAFARSQKNREEVYKYLKAAAKGRVWLDYSPGGNLYSARFEKWMRDSHHIYFKEAFTRVFLKDLMAIAPAAP
ncbi:hypothetical protein OZ410_03030 [Robiginitalea sp. M366]|uniref:hypothetical protein n=1 Tax=Robiginitalea aestuariiviva TaxID=3036903 RepID=UPI00240D7820|nr:hypothetical protein [Robiginitalea aestuariiviva]MDG1571272.1 hypothetical protein [Robiginitalea aestuariiviva]